MKVELLSIGEKWVGTGYTSERLILDSYPDAILVTETNEYKYYATNDYQQILFRMKRPKCMTKDQAESKYNIRIVGF